MLSVSQMHLYLVSWRALDVRYEFWAKQNTKTGEKAWGGVKVVGSLHMSKHMCVKGQSPHKTCQSSQSSAEGDGKIQGL